MIVKNDTETRRRQVQSSRIDYKILLRPAGVDNSFWLWDTSQTLGPMIIKGINLEQAPILSEEQKGFRL